MPIGQSGNASYVNNSGAGTTVQAAGLTAGGAGHTQLAMAISNSSSTVWSAPANFSLVDSGTGSGRSWAIFKATSSLVANPIFTSSVSALLSLAVVEFQTTSGVVDVHSTSFAGTSNTSQSTAVIPTTANDALVFFGMNDAPNSAVTTPPAGYTEVVPNGGAFGSQFGERVYFLLNPALSSQQPSIVWNFSPTGNTTFAAYVALKIGVQTQTISPTDTAATISDLALAGYNVYANIVDTAAQIADSYAIATTHSAAPDTGAQISDAPTVARTTHPAQTDTGAQVSDTISTQITRNPQEQDVAAQVSDVLWVGIPHGFQVASPFALQAQYGFKDGSIVQEHQ